MSGTIKTESGIDFPDLVFKLIDATSVFWLREVLAPNKEMQMSPFPVG